MPTTTETRRATADDLVDPADAVDPIGLLPAPPAALEPWPEPEPSSPYVISPRRLGGAVAVIFGTLFGVPLVIVLLRLMGSWPLPLLAGLFASVYVYRTHGRWRAGPGPLLRVLADRAPHIAAVETVERDGRGPFAGLALLLDRGSASPRRAFDPLDATDRAMARRLYVCRVDDGVAFVDGLRVDVAQLGRHPASVQDRVAEWIAVWAWLNGLSDPRAAWLGAMALAEKRLTARAEAALASLGDPPWADDLRRAMLTDGLHPARLAAAVHWADVEALDALLAASLDAPLTQRNELVSARLRLPDPPFERWLSEPGWGSVLVTLDAAQLEPAHWQRLVAEHPDPRMAAQAAARALSDGGRHAVRAARTLLDREDVWGAAHAWPDRAPIEGVELMLIRLGLDGAAEDLPRIGRWAEVYGLERVARRELETLRARVVGLPDGGGLALAPAAGGELCMAEPTGALCMAEPSGSAGRAPGRSPRGS